jgi:hypothetical protein
MAHQRRSSSHLQASHGGNHVTLDDQTLEKKLLLQRAYSPSDLYLFGKELAIPYFQPLVNCWEPNPDEAAFEAAQALDDAQLQELFKKHKPRANAVFHGIHFTLEDGILNQRGSLEKLRAGIAETEKKFGKDSLQLLKIMAQAGGTFTQIEYKEAQNQKLNPLPILEKLEQLKVVVLSFKGEVYREWKMLEETMPLIRDELGIPNAQRTSYQEQLLTDPSTSAPLAGTSTQTSQGAISSKDEANVDPLEDERQKINEMQNDLDKYLADLLKNRLSQTLQFGKTWNIKGLAKYLQDLFGEMLYADSFLSLIQQYSLCDMDIVNPQGKSGMKTGWSYALFGEPGTGKSFSTRDLILGIPGGKMAAHGIPGRNRYCGGITPARFIRIGQVYVGKTYNFIVPEFNDWFRYSGMVDVLKIAMERGEIKHELHREIIGPYRFDSFFSVNYNTAVMGVGKGYEVTIGDPNFNAIEDRMICRLHRLTKERYTEIANSQMKLALGQTNMDKMASTIRDHVTLTYAIQTGHPLVKARFPRKPVMITQEMYDGIRKARAAILKHIPGSMKFSARLEHNMVKFACAASLLSYFNESLEYIPVSADSLERAVRLYVEEAAVRSKEEFKAEDVVKELLKKK